MRSLDLISTANSNLRRSKLRTFLTILAISIGTFTLALSLGLGQGVRNYITSQLGDYQNVNIYQVNKEGANDFGGAFGNGDPQEYDPNKSAAVTDFSQAYLRPTDIDKIQEIDAVNEIIFPYAPAIDYASAPDGKKYTVPSSTFIPDIPVRITAGQNLDKNGDEGKVTISRKYVKLVGASSSEDAIGKELKITYTDAKGQTQEDGLIIKGTYEPTLIDSALTINSIDAKRLASAQAPTGEPTFFAVLATKDSSISDQEFKNKLSENKFSASSLADINNTLNNIVSGVQAALAAFSGIAILASVVGVVNTLFMAVLERTREIGLFRALGAKKKTIFGLFSVEAALLGFWGSVFGLIGAYGAQLAVNSIASNTFLKGIEGLQLLNITPMLAIMIVGIMATITMVAGIIPAFKASRLDPIEALRNE